MYLIKEALDTGAIDHMGRRYRCNRSYRAEISVKPLLLVKPMIPLRNRDIIDRSSSHYQCN